VRTPEDDRLRVFVDASVLGSAFGGIAAYVEELVGALADDPRLSLTVATSTPQRLGISSSVRVIRSGARTRDFVARTAWREARLGPLLRDSASDVLLAPVPELPLRPTEVPSVVVIHDVSQIAAPALYGWARWLRFSVGLPLACARATAVVCDSHATLRGLRCAVAGDASAKSRVIHPGPQRLPEPSETPLHGRPYLLYVGSLLPHKNLEAVLAALASGGSRLPVDLLLAGPATRDEEEGLSARARGLGLTQRVHHLGFVDRDQLSTAYRHARAVVLPSLMEGFGLPVLEAMGLGAPVVSSDLAPVREIGDDAVLYVRDPLNPEEWLDALIRLWSDEALRDRLSTRGLARAGQFSWRTAREEFSGLLHEVAGRT
jgi:glycosyltransferase involved in cell wall biosynthesis